MRHSGELWLLCCPAGSQVSVPVHLDPVEQVKPVKKTRDTNKAKLLPTHRSNMFLI